MKKAVKTHILYLCLIILISLLPSTVNADETGVFHIDSIDVSVMLNEDASASITEKFVGSHNYGTSDTFSRKYEYDNVTVTGVRINGTDCKMTLKELYEEDYTYYFDEFLGDCRLFCKEEETTKVIYEISYICRNVVEKRDDGYYFTYKNDLKLQTAKNVHFDVECYDAAKVEITNVYPADVYTIEKNNVSLTHTSGVMAITSKVDDEDIFDIANVKDISSDGVPKKSILENDTLINILYGILAVLICLSVIFSGKPVIVPLFFAVFYLPQLYPVLETMAVAFTPLAIFYGLSKMERPLPFMVLIISWILTIVIEAVFQPIATVFLFAVDIVGIAFLIFILYLKAVDGND